MFPRLTRVRRSPSKVDEYVQLVESYRDEQGRSRQRVVVSLGRKDQLSAQLDALIRLLDRPRRWVDSNQLAAPEQAPAWGRLLALRQAFQQLGLEDILDRLEVLPERMILSPDQSLSLLVRAHYDDGRSEDVTEWAKFRTVDEAVAKVDELGRTQVVGHGQGSVTAWFAQQIVVATITVPYPNSPDENVFTGSPSRNFIDD